MRDILSKSRLEFFVRRQVVVAVVSLALLAACCTATPGEDETRLFSRLRPLIFEELTLEGEEGYDTNKERADAIYIVLYDRYNNPKGPHGNVDLRFNVIVFDSLHHISPEGTTYLIPGPRDGLALGPCSDHEVPPNWCADGGAVAVKTIVGWATDIEHIRVAVVFIDKPAHLSMLQIAAGNNQMISDRITLVADHCSDQQPVPTAASPAGLNLTAAVDCIIWSYADNLVVRGALRPGLQDKLKAAVVLFQPRDPAGKQQLVVEAEWKRGAGGIFIIRLPKAPHIIVAALV